MSNALVLLRKYFFPSLLILVGLVLLIVGMSKDPATGLTQTSYFKLGALAVFFSGVIALAFELFKLPKIAYLLINIVLVVSVVMYGYFNYKSVKEMIVLTEIKQNRDEAVKLGLLDIQKLQDEYIKKYGKYAVDFTELKRFATKDSLWYLSKVEGVTPDRRMTEEERVKLGYSIDDKRVEVITEQEAIQLGLIIRDTGYMSVIEKLFMGPKVDDDEEKRAFEFDIDSLEYVRYYFTEKGDYERLSNYLNNNAQPTMYGFESAELDSLTNAFEVKDKSQFDPYSETKEPLKIGALDEPRTSGNWR